MKSVIHQDLRRTERRESHLWILSFGLLILFGTVLVGHLSMQWLSDADPASGLTRATAYRALGGLLFLIFLFCLHTLRTLVLNRRIKSLLVEMSGVAASGMELDDFLPAIARKIARACSVSSSQIVLLTHVDHIVRVKAAHAQDKVRWRPQIGKAYTLERLPVWQRVLEGLAPTVLSREEVERMPEGHDRELLTGGREDCCSFLVVPMVGKGCNLGILVLGESRNLLRRRFTPARVAMARTLASYVAGAIEQSRLKTDAIRDPLTNLYNRRHFTDKIREELVRADRGGHNTVLLLCDLDRFKAVNDTRGHDTGDAVLKAVARSIQHCTRGADMVFRWGGDEIVVVLTKSSRAGALIVANRIRQGVAGVAAATGLDIDVSIGVSLYPEFARTEVELLRVADRALYIAKQKTGDKIQVGEEEYRLDRRSIKIVFQPVVDVTTDRILGYEALSRDPQGKLSALALFEKYQAIGRLSELKQIAFESQIEVAQQVGLKRVFVNADFDMLRQLDPIPKPTDLDVVVELSELEALTDLDSCLEIARRWRANGYKFAVDDFGAGYISFPFLAMLVPDYIKVDRSTMLQAVSSERFRKFLKALIRAVKTYAPSGIIAEGIERERELRLAQDLDISLVQGFLFGKPRELSSIGIDAEAPRPEPVV